jgi:DNA-binding transcriptional regulator YiaG
MLDSPVPPGHSHDDAGPRQGPPAGIDPKVASPARMYDYYLGGSNNFPADRLAAEKALSVVPDGRRIALANRYFLAHATLRMADRGICQFLDLGTGILTSPSVHEVAREVRHTARVVYADNDPVVVARNKVLLSPIETVRVIQADIRQPETVLNNPSVRDLIDFSQPVGLLMVAVLHFITDDEDPDRIVATFTSKLAPGSYFALSHISSDGTSLEAIATIRDAYANAAAPAIFRTAAQIRGFFDGFVWEPPGLIDVVDWFPYSKVFTARPPTVQVLGGLGSKELWPLPCLMPDTENTEMPKAIRAQAMTRLPGRWLAAFSGRILAGWFSGAPTAASSGPTPACPCRRARSCTPPTRTPSRPESARPDSATSLHLAQSRRDRRQPGPGRFHSPGRRHETHHPCTGKGPLMPASTAAPSTHGGSPWTFPVDGARLRALRQKHGLSRQVLARQAGISASTVAKIEQQRRTRCQGRTLARLSAVLGEDPRAIIVG